MVQPNEILNPTEALEMGTAIAEAADTVDIEEVLRRAREIHRQHGGIVGYDFEDWVLAWNELPRSASCKNPEPADEWISQ